MRVVHVVRQFHPSVGGLQEMVHRLAVALTTNGCRSSVVTLDRAYEDINTELVSESVIDGIPVSRVPFVGSQRYPIAPAILLRIAEADLVHVHGIDFAFDYLAVTKPFHRKPLVASTHGGFFHTGFARNLKRIYFNTVTRLSALAYRRIYAVSESDGRLFSSIVSPDRLRTIENGVDIEKFANAAASRATRTMVYFGRISEPKRIDLIFPLLSSLRRTDERWRLIVAGREWGVSFETLRRLAQASGLESAIRFVPGPDDDALAAIIGESSLFVSLSSFEGFGLAAVEAMSAGLTPVLSDIPPFRQLVARVGRGLVVEPGDPEAAALQVTACVEALERDFAPERDGLIAAAREYAWPSIAARYMNDYRTVLSER